MNKNNDALADMMRKANNPTKKTNSQDEDNTAEITPVNSAPAHKKISKKAKEQLIKKYTNNEQEEAEEESDFIKKEPVEAIKIEAEENDDTKKSKAYLQKEKEIEALELTINALLEKLDAQSNPTSAEAIFLKEELEKAKERKADKEVELSAQEQGKEVEEIDEEEISREIAKKMLQDDEDRQKERKRAAAKEAETTADIDATAMALIELQKALEQRGVQSVITGTGNHAYLQTDAQGELGTIDPKKLDITKIDVMLKEAPLQHDAKNNAPTNEKDSKAALLEKYTQNHNPHDPRIEATINQEVGSYGIPLPKNDH